MLQAGTRCEPSENHSLDSLVQYCVPVKSFIKIRRERPCATEFGPGRYLLVHDFYFWLPTKKPSHMIHVITSTMSAKDQSTDTNTSASKNIVRRTVITLCPGQRVGQRVASFDLDNIKRTWCSGRCQHPRIYIHWFSSVDIVIIVYFILQLRN